MKIPPSIRWRATGRALGQGGQAAVVEVVDSKGEIQGRYALKGLSPGRPPKIYERFAREVGAIKTISHPFVVRVVDHSGSDSDFHYYVMELIDGAVPLKRLLNTDSNPFFGNPLAALSFFADLLSAIQAWSGRQIVHRDLSPSNVLILPDQSIKVIDFGICQIADAEPVTLSDEGVGTQNYMAPECESGAEGEVSVASDLYSAGKLLWSAITNLNAFSRERPAFASKSMHAMFPENPASWHLHHVFEKTIRHSPGNRFSRVEDALASVRDVRYLIASHYPPIELIGERCPLCGFGVLSDFQGAHMVFGNPNPPGISAAKCSYCGYCFARAHGAVRTEQARRDQLQ
jgi:serine/threonine protein kinase